MSSAGTRTLSSSPHMVTAVRDGTFVDHIGCEQHIEAGKTQTELRRPEVAALFGLDGFSRTATSPPTAPPPKLRFYPTLEATREVILSRFAADTIRSTINSSPRGLEVGGWLCADRRNPTFVRMATEPGRDATFSRSSGMLGKDVLRELQASAPHLIPVGDYHLHPEGGDLPSPADRETWAANVGSLGFNVSVLAVPGKSWLSDPTLSGWLTVREGTSLVCERLHLREV